MEVAVIEWGWYEHYEDCLMQTDSVAVMLVIQSMVSVHCWMLVVCQEQQGGEMGIPELLLLDLDVH